MQNIDKLRRARVLTAMVTPFDETLSLNMPMAVRLARHLLANGSDGVVLSGTTGESPTLSDDEKQRLFCGVVEALDGKGVVLAGTGHYATAEAIRLAKLAEAAQVDGLLVIAPYYNRPDQNGLYEHFKAIAASVALPIILYNHPGRTGVHLSPETVERLAALDNIAGIKDSSGSLENVTAYRLVTPPDFLIYSGDDPLTLPVLAVGGHGVISVSAHMAGRAIQSMVQHWLQGDIQFAQKCHDSLFVLSKALFSAPSPAPVKHALRWRGLDTGGVRLPLTGLDPATVAQLEAVLTSSGILD